ncbi:MAG: hypothetical protein ABEK59_08100 [Halobacteria archaeon]
MPVNIDVYVITGTRYLDLPSDFCRECHLFVGVAQRAADEVEVPVEVEVYSWWRHPFAALRKGGYHPPVMLINGRMLCQGHEVPTVDGVVETIESVSRRD